MSGIVNHTVIYKAAVLDRIIRQSLVAFPNETGVFLIGYPRNDARDVWHIDDLFCIERDGNSVSWAFRMKDLADASEYAGHRGRVVLGTAHSHPHKKFNLMFTSLSHADADVDERLHLPLALVVGVCEDGWDISTWRTGYSAQLYQMVSSRGRTHFYTKWARLQKDHVWLSSLVHKQLAIAA